MSPRRSSTIKRVTVSLAVLALHAVPATALAAAGDLDPSFGTDGTVTVEGAPYRSNLHAVVDPQGRTLVAGEEESGIFVRRYDASGAVDRTFGSDGEWDLYENGPPQLEAITLLPDGRVVAVGYLQGDALVVVLSPDGELVKQHLIDNGGGEAAYAAAPGPGGTVLVAGSTSAGQYGDAVVWRLDPVAGLDPTFDGDGIASLDTGVKEWAWALAVMEDGRIVVGGSVWTGSMSNDAAVWRLKPDGDPADEPNSALDPTFDGDGVAILHEDATQQVRALALLPGNEILAGGFTTIDPTFPYSDAMVWRLKAGGGDGSVNGALDRSFDGDGRVRIGVDEKSEIVSALVRQPDGAVVAVGESRREEKANALAWRLRADGPLDPAFGTGGTKLLPGETAHSIALMPDRRMLIAGDGVPDGAYLWRLMGDPFTLTVARTGGGQGTVVSDPGGLTCTTTCVGGFELGATPRLLAVPASGSAFAGWSGEGCSGTGECAVTMDADRAVEARFDLVPGGAGGSLIEDLPTPAFGRRTLVTLKVSRRKRGRVTVTVRNANAFPVTGTLRVVKPRGVRRRALRIPAMGVRRLVLRLPRARQLVLRAAVKDPAGTVRTVRLRRAAGGPRSPS